MTTTITATGEFDYANRRGVLQMGGGLVPGGVEIRYLPPRIYVRIADAAAFPGGPSGKPWVEIQLPSQADGSLPFLPPGDVNASPMDLLSALTAIASNVTDLGSATIRGVAVTHYRVMVDLAKAEAQQRPQARAEFHAFASSLNATMLPVDVWVDGQSMVRRLAVSLPVPRGSGMPAGLRLSEAVDFYDFGIPVLVSAPPASEVTSANEFSQSMSGSGAGSPPPVSPPPVSGTLSAAQASAAEQAVRAFWTALSSNSAQAVEQAVVPSQRDCVAGFLQGPIKFKVSSLQITGAKPAGTGKATVWFSVNATVQIGGQTVPMGPGAPGSANWMLATESGGAWYADLSNSGSGFLPPCPPTAF